MAISKTRILCWVAQAIVIGVIIGISATGIWWLTKEGTTIDPR